MRVRERKGRVEGEELVCVYVTAPTLEVARAIAIAALDAKAAACANILQGESLYDWEGRRVQENEHVLFLKTTREAVSRLMEIVRANHPAEVPCIEVIPILDAHGPYAKWVAAAVRWP